MTQGMAYILSLMLTSVVVAAVYSAAMDANLGTAALIRKTSKRLGKLVGVLAGLAIVVWVLGRF